MSGINSCVLVGRLTKDPDIRVTQSGTKVCQFTVAVNRHGQKDSADFIQCVAWKQSAEFLGMYAHKGQQICIEGRIQTRNYDDKDGKRVYVTEVICERLELIRQDVTAQEYNRPQQPKPQPTNLAEQFDTMSVPAINSDDLPF